MNSWFVLLSKPLLPPGDREFLHRMFLACVLSAAALRTAGVWDGGQRVPGGGSAAGSPATARATGLTGQPGMAQEM